MNRTLVSAFIFFTMFALCASSENKRSGEKPNPKRILEKAGVEYAYPHFSNDATEILFQSNESGIWRICKMSVNGTHVQELTTDTTNSYFADWSPDNNHICFVSDRTGNEEIYLMNSDGSDQRQLTGNKARNIHPYFSPDGTTILFSSTWNTRGDLEIFRMNPDGTGIERITRSPDNETCARMSPGGTVICYLKNNDTGLDDLYLLNLADSSETNLTNTITRDGWPTWSPDGRQIIFSAVQDDVYKLFAFDIEQRSLTRLTNPAQFIDDCRANVSSDGKRIVFNRQHDDNGKRTNAIYVLFL